jgi:hypothetical protein
MKAVNSYELGDQVGEAGFRQFLDRADQIRTHEKERIEIVTDIESAPLKAQLEVLTHRYDELQQERREAATKTMLDVRWIRRAHVVMTCALCGAGFFLCESTLSQFALGWEVWAISMGQATTLAVSTDKLLHVWKTQRFLIALVATAFVAGLVTLISLALIRADLFAFLMHQQLTTSGINDQNALGESFYTSTGLAMRIFTAALAISMELMAGVMWHDLKVASVNREPVKDLDAKILKIEEEVADILAKLHDLKNRGKAFEATFKRDLAIALLRGIRESGVAKWAAAITLCVLLSAPFAHARAHTDVVALYDLSISMGTSNAPDASDKRKTLTGILMNLPPDSSVVVIGITDMSFAQPQILLTGEVPADPGPLPLFNRIVAARRKLAADIASKPERFLPRYNGSDIVGAIKYAAEHFKAAPPTSSRILAIVSDMRQVSSDLDLESPPIIDAPLASKRLLKSGLVLALPNVDVFVCNANTSRRSTAYWDSLKTFWTELLRQAGARLRMYSPTDDIPSFQIVGGGRSGSR